MNSLEELRKNFIMDEDAEQLNVERLIERLSKFCKIDINGYLFVNDKSIIQKLTIKDKIMLALSARFLANKLQEKLGQTPTISAEVSSEELTKFFSDKKEVIQARAKELKDDGKILVKERGSYAIYPFQIDDFITLIETR